MKIESDSELHARVHAKVDRFFDLLSRGARHRDAMRATQLDWPSLRIVRWPSRFPELARRYRAAREAGEMRREALRKAKNDLEHLMPR